MQPFSKTWNWQNANDEPIQILSLLFTYYPVLSMKSYVENGGLIIKTKWFTSLRRPPRTDIIQTLEYPQVNRQNRVLGSKTNS